MAGPDGSDRHLAWRHFRDMIHEGIPAVQPIGGKPVVHVFVDEGGQRIGLRVPVAVGTLEEPSPLAEVATRLVQVAGEPVLEVSTRSNQLFAEFYALLEEMADRIQLRGDSPQAALRATLSGWKALLRPTERMSDEQRVGLFGELLVLYRLVQSAGIGAVAAWTGPLSEPHDFRLGDYEIEVKTTTGRKAQHLISSVAQLEPSPQRVLFMLSCQLEPAGLAARLTLPGLVDLVRGVVPAGTKEREAVESALLFVWRYSDLHAPFYDVAYAFRARAHLVPVTSDLPRISTSLIESLPEFGRLGDIQYRLDVTGLGIEDGTATFLAVLPGSFPL